MNRGYPYDVVLRARTKAFKVDRNTLFKQRSEDQATRIHCSIVYNEHALNIRKSIHKHWHIVKHLPQCKQTPIIGFKKTASIRNMIVRTVCHFERDCLQHTGHLKCRHYKVYKYALQIKEVPLPGFQHPLKLQAYTTCKSSDIVYVTVCPCQFLYVALSQCPVKIRILEHVARLRNKVLDVLLTEHYMSAGHSPEDVRFLLCFSLNHIHII